MDDDDKEFPTNRWGAPIGDGLIHLHDLDFDFEDYFKRYPAELLEGEGEEFSARVYGLICRDFFKSGGDPGAVPKWAMSYLVNKLYQVLGGVPWNDIMRMPWDVPTPYMTPKGQRAFDIYAFVENTLLDTPGANVTDLISEAARKHHVSYETARADYYAIKGPLKSGKGIPSKFLIPNDDF